MKDNHMVIWRDLSIVIRSNGHKEWAEVPVANYNIVTERLEAVVNPRGWGYARCKDDKYRRKVK